MLWCGLNICITLSCQTRSDGLVCWDIKYYTLLVAGH